MFRYGKDFMRIKFRMSDDLPCNKIINILVCIVIVSSIFKENNEYYPQECYPQIFQNNSAFSGYARSYKIEIVDKRDSLVQLEASKSSIEEDLFKDLLNKMKGFKYQI